MLSGLFPRYAAGVQSIARRIVRPIASEHALSHPRFKQLHGLSLRAAYTDSTHRHTLEALRASCTPFATPRRWKRTKPPQVRPSLAKTPRPEAPATVPLAAVELSATEAPKVRSFQKADAAAELGLMVRDMRVVDASFRSSSPTVFARDACIVAHLDHVRVIVTTDRVLVFDPANPVVEDFIPKLQARLQSQVHPLPFEFRAMEGVLVDVCARLNANLGNLIPSVDMVLDTLSTTTDFGGNTVQDCLDRLLPLENSLNEFALHVDQLRRTLHEVLASDEDMSMMYLSDFRDTGRRRRVDQHDEVEIMLENYIKQIDTVQSEVNSTLRAVKATENVTQIRLDAMRNRILRLEVLLNLAAVSVAVGGLVAGLFGMNLHTGWEEEPGVFWAVSFIAGGIAFLTFRACTVFLRMRGIFR